MDLQRLCSSSTVALQLKSSSSHHLRTSSKALLLLHTRVSPHFVVDKMHPFCTHQMHLRALVVDDIKTKCERYLTVILGDPDNKVAPSPHPTQKSNSAKNSASSTVNSPQV